MDDELIVFSNLGTLGTTPERNPRDDLTLPLLLHPIGITGLWYQGTQMTG